MITLPPDWENVLPAGENRPKPEPGAYVCRIVKVSIGKDRMGTEKMHLDLDIDEGPHKGYFSDDYRQMKSRRPEYAFWKLTMHLPIDFNALSHGKFYAQLFKRFTNNLRASNDNAPLFNTPQVNEQTLKGLKIGALLYVREKPDVSGKYMYWNYYVDREYSVSDVREGKCPDGWFEDGSGHLKPPVNTNNPSKDPDLTPVSDIDIPF